MDTSKFSNNRSISVPVAVSLLGWALYFIGLCISQARFNETLVADIAVKNPFGLNWFFLFYWMAVLIGTFFLSVKDCLESAQQTVSFDLMIYESVQIEGSNQ
jgi:hypothetical protein